MWDALLQVALTVMGLAALWMMSGTNRRQQFWAPFIGLAAQPFWMIYAVRSGAFGIGILTLAFALVYLRACRIQLHCKDRS